MSDNNFYCEICKKTFSNISALNKHKKTESHLKRELESEDLDETEQHKEHKGKKEAKQVSFFCPLCEYETKRLNDMEKHTNSKAHKNAVETYKNVTLNIPFGSIPRLSNPEELKIGFVKTYDEDENKDVMKYITEDDIKEKFNINIDGDKNIKEKHVPKSVLQRRERQSKYRESQKDKGITKKVKTEEEKQKERKEIESNIKDLERQIKKYETEIKEAKKIDMIIIKETKINREAHSEDIKKHLKEVNDLYDEIMEEKNLTKKEIKKEVSSALLKNEHNKKLDLDDKYYINLNEKLKKLDEKYNIYNIKT